jgi:tripartite-type tricarboxylate transporter receptor subunit TctC
VIRQSIPLPALLCAGLAIAPALAQDPAAGYPNRPIRFIIASAAGGSPDTVSRILAAELTKQLGQQLVIDNRPGGGQTIGTRLIVDAPPDGYTIGYGNVVTLVINLSLLAKQPYDPDRDLQLVSRMGFQQNVFAVTPSLPVKTLPELIEHAKQNPGRLMHASSGNGTTGHIGGEMFKMMAGIQLVHVPYRGSPQAITDLISGQAHFMSDNMASILPHVKSGRVRGLAVTGARRSPVLPDLPTVSEAGVPGYEASGWGGVVVPARVPGAIVARLNAEINKAMQSPALREKYFALGYETLGGTVEEFAAYVKSERTKWSEVIRKSGARAE